LLQFPAPLFEFTGVAAENSLVYQSEEKPGIALAIEFVESVPVKRAEIASQGDALISIRKSGSGQKAFNYCKEQWKT